MKNKNHKSIDNFILEGWTPTPVEQSLMDGTFNELLNESVEQFSENIPSDFLEVQDLNAAMEEIKTEIDRWQL